MVGKRKKMIEGEGFCTLCGRTFKRGEHYICIEGEKICRSCGDDMDTWQILELLEYGRVFDLFAEKGKTKRWEKEDEK